MIDTDFHRKINMNKILPGKIRLLKKYFKDESSVILAFLFGSFSRGFETEESDLDIAVYIKDDNSVPLREAEDRIFGAMSDIIEKEVDLVCLNQAPASLVSNVFKTGIPLVIKDKILYGELYLKASAEAEDFLEFLEDFRRIKLQSQSLSPEEKERLIL
jgi:predicted nucleotidyltransferase